MASAGKGEHMESLGSEFVYDYVCQPCQSDGKILEAAGLCTDCQEYLCKRCFDSHTIPSMMRHHVLLDKQQMLKKIPISRKDKCTEKCPQHDDRVIEYYCKNHSILGCTVCITMKHRTCDIEFIPDVANNLSCSKEFQMFETQLKSADNKSKEAVREIKEKIKMVNKSHTEAIQAVRDYRQEINDALDKIENEINEKAKQIQTDAVQKLTNNLENFNTVMTQIQDLKSKIENVKKTNQNCDLYITAIKSAGRLQLLHDKLTKAGDSEIIKTYKFQPQTELLEMLKGPIGLGQLCEIESTPVAGAKGPTTKPKGPITGVKHSTDINVRSSTDTSICLISGCTILPDNQYIVVTVFNYSKKIKMCNIKQGSVTSELVLRSGPWDITNIGESHVAVTVPGEHKIWFITTNQVLTLDRDINVNGQCRGVVQCSDGRLIVSYAGLHKVEIMKLDGTVLSTIAKDNKGNDIFSNPYYVTINPDNKTMYVSNCGTGTVVCLRLDGTVVATYKDSQLSQPMKIVVDGDGMVYICGEESHNIHQVTGDCSKGKVLMTSVDGLQNPKSICYSKAEERFYVGMNNNDTIKVFQVIYAVL